MKQLGKSGIYVRLSHSERDKNAEYMLSHPLVDAISVNFYWSEIEAAPGQFDFGPIDRLLDLCRRNKKGLIFEITPYGVEGDRNFAPEWLYELGVKRILVNDPKDPHSHELAMPRVWESACTDEFAKLVHRMGDRYQHETAIWYLVPAIGYNSTLGVFPSKDSGVALSPALKKKRTVKSGRTSTSKSLASMSSHFRIRRSCLRCRVTRDGILVAARSEISEPYWQTKMSLLCRSGWKPTWNAIRRTTRAGCSNPLSDTPVRSGLAWLTILRSGCRRNGVYTTTPIATRKV